MKEYKELRTASDLACYSLEMAVLAIDSDLAKKGVLQRISMQSALDLYVGRGGFRVAVGVVSMAVSPFSIWINIHVDDDFADDEWCAEFNGIAYGSKGA